MINSSGLLNISQSVVNANFFDESKPFDIISYYIKSMSIPNSYKGKIEEKQLQTMLMTAGQMICSIFICYFFYSSLIT